MTADQTGSPKDNHILARLSPMAFERLLPHLEFVWVTASEILHESGKKQEFAYFPTTTVVALVHMTGDGDSTLVAMVGREGLVGIVQVLGDHSLPIRSLVQTAGRAWRIKTPDFRKALFGDGSLMHQCLGYTQLLITHMAQLVTCTRHHRLEQQLCRWMLFSLDRLPSNSIECTQEMVAALLGVRRQGVAEASARLEADGIIDRKRGQITVRKRALLEQRSCECYGAIKREQERLFTALLPDPSKAQPGERACGCEAAFSPSASRLELALAGSCLAWWDLYVLSERMVVNHSQNWPAMLGLQQQNDAESGAANWDDQVHADDIPARNAALQACIDGEVEMFESEFRVHHQSGQWIWFAARGRVAQRDGAGRPMRLVGTTMDISARKKAELSLKAMANTDFLTGTASRRHFFDIAEREFERSMRYNLPLSLLALDLDHFKQINDEHGHAGGDRVLKSLVDTVGDFLRMTDIFGRTGGEEFCLLLPNTDAEGAVALAQRILQAVRQTPTALEPGFAAYTVSIGVSHRVEETQSFEALMKSADHALYRAKALGRNRTERALA